MYKSKNYEYKKNIQPRIIISYVYILFYRETYYRILICILFRNA